jgi:hypothetical protein
VPYSSQGQSPAKHWEHIGWNPIQTGDDFDNSSQVLAHENDGRILYIKCQPLQWPLNHVPGECTFESWLELDGPVVKARARLNNARSDHHQYPARHQELPAVYANAAFPRVVSYLGDQPFTQAAISEVPQPKAGQPWSYWQGTEGWAALLNAQNQGLGLITPQRSAFVGGFAGQAGPNDTFGNATGYLAGLSDEILDHNITFEFRYELLAGSLAEIRARAEKHRPTDLPGWDFAKDRHGWHHRHASDQGWPVTDHLRIALNQKDPQILSPFTFWKAADAGFVIIEAAFSEKFTSSKPVAHLFWQSYGAQSPGPDQVMAFPVIRDGEFHRYVVPLAESPAYRGHLIRLRLDPGDGGEESGFVKIRSIRLTSSTGRN